MARAHTVLPTLLGFALGITLLVGCAEDRRPLHERLAGTPSRGPRLPELFAQQPGDPLAIFDYQFDDSGFRFAAFYTKWPENDTSQTLKQIRDAFEGRSARAIATLEESLAADPDDPRDRRAMIAIMHAYAGNFDRASELLQAFDAEDGPILEADLDLLRGIIELRRGEVANCIACCTEQSCLYPLGPEAVHLQREGSERAVQSFLAYLEKQPKDLLAKYLLSIAAMTLGEYPEAVPETYRLPLLGLNTPSAPTPDLDGPESPKAPIAVPDLEPFRNIATLVGLLEQRGETMAGGSIFDDFNGDHRPDIFLSSYDSKYGAALLLNRGDGTFGNVSEAADLTEQVAALNCNQADFDNDGHLDVLLMRGGWERPLRLSLLRNRGDATFEDVTVQAGLDEPIATQAAGWADYDNDGDLDLYVAGEVQGSWGDAQNYGRLYQNQGDGTFTNVAKRAGVENGFAGKGVAWGDYDDDGWIDLYVTNLNGPNRLFHNNGDGTFEGLAERLGVTEPMVAFPCWFFDYDNDGRLDICANGYQASMTDVIGELTGRRSLDSAPRIYRNRGPLGEKRFADLTVELGLDHDLLPMGCNFGDIDNDGYPDIYLGTGRPQYSNIMPNRMFANLRGHRFVDVTVSTNTGHLQKGHGVSFADWDADGDLDILLNAGGATPGDRAHDALFLNPGRPERHSITLKLVGTTTNRSAIGARISVAFTDPETGEAQQRHVQVSSGSSFGGNGLAQTIGIDRAETIDRITIDWPTSGTQTVFEDVPADRFLLIIEGQDDYEVVDLKPIAID